MKARIVGGKETRLAQHGLELPPVAVTAKDFRPYRAPVRSCSNQFQLEPRPAFGLVIAQQGRRLVHVHDENIHIAVIVEVAESAPAAHVWRGDAWPGLLNQFFEPAAA